MLGAATHYVAGASLGDGLAVSTREPAVPLARRGAVQVISGLLLVAGLLFGYQEYLRYQLEDLTKTNMTLRDTVDQLAGGASLIRELAESRREGEKELEINSQKIDAIREEIEFLSVTMTRRTDYLISLLDGLARHIKPDMELDSISEGHDLGVRVEGWALKESSAQTFASGFTDLLELNGMKFHSISVTADAERQGVNGYLFEVIYMPTDEVRSDG